MLIRELWAAIAAQDADAVEPLIHPDARLEMAMARGRLTEGRADVMEALREAWTDVHSITINGIHEVSTRVVVVDGRSRHPTPMGGFADTGVVWRCEFRDGMLWRQSLHVSVAEALAAGDEPRS